MSESVPTVVPSVHTTVALPFASVTLVADATLPPPAVTAQFTVALASGAPF